MPNCTLSLTVRFNNWNQYSRCFHITSRLYYSLLFIYFSFLISWIWCAKWPADELIQQEQEECEDHKCSTDHWKSSAIASGFDYKESWRQRDDILKIFISQAVFKIHCVLNQLSKITLDPILAHYPLMHEMCSFTLNANLKALVQHSSHKVTGFLILV